MYEKVFLNKYGFYELKNKPFVEDMKKDKDIKVILKNLFSAIDVKNFGSTFAKKKRNFLTIKCDKKE